jgi:hypothetical protein
LFGAGLPYRTPGGATLTGARVMLCEGVDEVDVLVVDADELVVGAAELGVWVGVYVWV